MEHPSTVPPAKLTVAWLLDNRCQGRRFRPGDARSAISTVRGIAERTLTDRYGVPAPTAAWNAVERDA